MPEDEKQQSTQGVVKGCLIIIVLGVVIIGACTGIVVACSGDGGGSAPSAPARDRYEGSLTIMDRECLQFAQATGLRSRSFTEQDIRANYTGWMQNVVRHCSTMRPAVRDVCREMESIGLNPRNRDDLYDVLDAFGRASQINEFVAAVEVWCD